MPELEIIQDQATMASTRRKGRDESVDDAMKTMERFSDWLVACQQRNPWLEYEFFSRGKNA